MSADNDESTSKDNIQKDYEILREDYPNYDLSFKVIVIGNSGNYYYYINNIYRCGEIVLINASNKAKI